VILPAEPVEKTSEIESGRAKIPDERRGFLCVAPILGKRSTGYELNGENVKDAKAEKTYDR